TIDRCVGRTQTNGGGRSNALVVSSGTVGFQNCRAIGVADEEVVYVGGGSGALVNIHASTESGIATVGIGIRATVDVENCTVLDSATGISRVNKNEIDIRGSLIIAADGVESSIGVYDNAPGGGAVANRFTVSDSVVVSGQASTSSYAFIDRQNGRPKMLVYRSILASGDAPDSVALRHSSLDGSINNAEDSIFFTRAGTERRCIRERDSGIASIRNNVFADCGLGILTINNTDYPEICDGPDDVTGNIGRDSCAVLAHDSNVSGNTLASSGVSEVFDSGFDIDDPTTWIIAPAGQADRDGSGAFSDGDAGVDVSTVGADELLLPEL
ncbi:MAG: hypothetical protein AAF658_11665, partial [Myxococcota bacterium]